MEQVQVAKRSVILWSVMEFYQFFPRFYQILSFNVNKHWLKSLHFSYVLHKLLKLHVWQKGGHVKSRNCHENFMERRIVFGKSERVSSLGWGNDRLDVGQVWSGLTGWLTVGPARLSYTSCPRPVWAAPNWVYHRHYMSSYKPASL